MQTTNFQQFEVYICLQTHINLLAKMRFGDCRGCNDYVIS